MTDNGDRLNRIESILEGLAQNLTQVQEQSQRQFSDANDRLTRIEQAQDRNQQQFADANDRLTRIEQALDETRKIADSNARSIEAWSLTIEDDRAEREQVESELRVDINQIRETLNRTTSLQQTLFTSQIADREEWHQQRTEINQQIQGLIDSQNQDRQNFRQQREQLNSTVQETQQQIQSLVANQERDRQEARQQRDEINRQIQDLIALSRQNTQAHAEFRADIQRLSDRLAG